MTINLIRCENLTSETFDKIDPYIAIIIEK